MSKIHKITKLTPNQAQQLVGRIVHGHQCDCDTFPLDGDLPWETTVSTTTVSKITKGITNAEACALHGLRASFVNGDGEKYATGKITSSYTDADGDTRVVLNRRITIYLYQDGTGADGHILIDGPLPWEASDAPESDAAPEACETPRERVERLTAELSDAQAALRNEGLPDGWHRQRDDTYGMIWTTGPEADPYQISLGKSELWVSDADGDTAHVDFGALCAFVDMTRAQRAENA